MTPQSASVRRLAGFTLAVALAGGALLFGIPDVSVGADPTSRTSLNDALVARIVQAHGLTGAQAAKLGAIFSASSLMGQGNPVVTRHPMTEAECQARAAAADLRFDDATARSVCGGPYMAPLYDPATQTPADATACIDQLEFPDIPCAYPVVWVRPIEAVQICEAMGKRLCDAHEWEGACEGAVTAPDYRFDLAVGQSALSAVGRMRAAHNSAQRDHRWSYGDAYRRGVCAADSDKSPGCNGGDWRACGSNTYPAGAFPQCHSALGVYDLNGNAAEGMNLPLKPDQLASAGSAGLGVTELKGSWFIFDKYRAHEDWCRWRAPYWHGTKVMDPDSHRNYHLGFRCCKTVTP